MKKLNMQKKKNEHAKENMCIIQYAPPPYNDTAYTAVRRFAHFVPKSKLTPPWTQLLFKRCS